MLRLAVLVLAFCATSYAIDHCCSHEDRDIVQRQWKVLWKDTSSSKIKIGFGRIILTKLVEAKPDLKELFKTANVEHPESPEFSAFAIKILADLDLLINLLQDPEALEAQLDVVAERFGTRVGLKPEHLQTFAELLNKGLRRVLDDYNSMSWKACFRGIFTKIGSKLHA